MVESTREQASNKRRQSRPQSLNTGVGCLSKKCSVIGAFLMVESSREQASNKKPQK